MTGEKTRRSSNTWNSIASKIENDFLLYQSPTIRKNKISKKRKKPFEWYKHISIVLRLAFVGGECQVQQPHCPLQIHLQHYPAIFSWALPLAASTQHPSYKVYLQGFYWCRAMKFSASESSLLSLNCTLLLHSCPICHQFHLLILSLTSPNPLCCFRLQMLLPLNVFRSESPLTPLHSCKCRSSHPLEGCKHILHRNTYQGRRSSTVN